MDLPLKIDKALQHGLQPTEAAAASQYPIFMVAKAMLLMWVISLLLLRSLSCHDPWSMTRWLDGRDCDGLLVTLPLNTWPNHFFCSVSLTLSSISKQVRQSSGSIEEHIYILLHGVYVDGKWSKQRMCHKKIYLTPLSKWLVTNELSVLVGLAQNVGQQYYRDDDLWQKGWEEWCKALVHFYNRCLNAIRGKWLKLTEDLQHWFCLGSLYSVPNILGSILVDDFCISCSI